MVFLADNTVTYRVLFSQRWDTSEKTYKKYPLKSPAMQGFLMSKISVSLTSF